MRSLAITLLALSISLGTSHPFPDGTHTLQHDVNDDSSSFGNFRDSTTGTKSNGDLIDSAPDGIKRAFTGQPITGSSLSGRNIVTESSEVSCGDRKHYLDVRRFEQNVTDFCDLYAKLGKMPPYDTPQYKDYKIRQTNQAHPKDNGNHLILTLSIQTTQNNPEMDVPTSLECQDKFKQLSIPTSPCYGEKNHDTRGGTNRAGIIALFGAQLQGPGENLDQYLPKPKHRWDQSGFPYSWHGASVNKTWLGPPPPTSPWAGF